MVEYIRAIMRGRVICTSLKMRKRLAFRLQDEARQLKALFKDLVYINTHTHTHKNPNIYKYVYHCVLLTILHTFCSLSLMSSFKRNIKKNLSTVAKSYPQFQENARTTESADLFIFFLSVRVRVHEQRHSYLSSVSLKQPVHHLNGKQEVGHSGTSRLPSLKAFCGLELFPWKCPNKLLIPQRIFSLRTRARVLDDIYSSCLCETPLGSIKGSESDTEEL